MILLCGIPSETPLALVARELEQIGAEFRFVNQRAVASYRMDWAITDSGIDGVLALQDEEIGLSGVVGVYLRLMDERFLPELNDVPATDPAACHSRAFHAALFQWAEITPARVVNRAEPQGSNGSKPFQAQIIARYGLKPPPTLVTNDPDAVVAFRAEHGRVIYKSISAARSIVRELRDEDIDRLDQIRWCPVQFQALIPGADIRVHVVGGEIFATEIVSSHIDYRYAKRDGGTTELNPIELDPGIAERCVELTRGLGLAFAGIDLKLTPDGDYYCFEANPSPAFSYFEANTGQPIADAVARYLASG